MKNKLSFLIILGFFISVFAQTDEIISQRTHIFENLKDEYKIVSYFFSHAQKKYYKQLDPEDKWDYIAAFWEIQNLNPQSDENEFLSEIVQRINYCDLHFSHFQDGWKTDMGRIYIKHGPPFETQKRKTGTDSKFAQKDYQIWKYRISGYMTYLFLDLQQSGDYRLIYSEGDDTEGSWADWTNYLGTDFNEGLLQ
ncbi:MAG: GWxTD domain-containing protein [Candidatus Cloacimonetes bacterium]|nr:GWxTD domain-containing protein [Candidatus Cloacimonadota bacterium]